MSNDDRMSVIGVVNLYALAVDTQCWSLFDAAFSKDVHADFGRGAVWNDLASFKRDFEAIHAPFDATQHVTTNHNVSLHGDTAHCLSYVHGRFIRDVPGGNMFESTGWYDDRLARIDGEWRITHRVCRMIWWGGNPRVLETVEGLKAEHQLDSLRGEARAGRLAYLRALGVQT